MGYQPEERYWTDYLRIALPVVGLLLMLGLFWFWAASLIGDEDDDSPGNVAANTPVPTAVATVAGAAPTDVPGGEAAANGAQVTATTPPEGQGEAATDEDPGVAGEGTDVTVAAGVEDGGSADTDNPPDAESCEAEYCPDALVVTITDVNLRSEATTEEDNVVTVIPSGEELTVLTESSEGDDGNTWVEVEFGDDTGFVATSNLEPSTE